MSNSKPLFIAEIGVNHEGNILKAKEMIVHAKKAGADVAKFQTYKKELLAAPNSPSYWSLQSEPTTSQYELFGKYDSFNHEDYIELSQFCLSSGIEFMTTCFDVDSVFLMNEIVTRFKIASADLTNYQLLRAVAKTNKPILLSTGAASLSEIEEALKFIATINDSSRITLLHCVLNYPTKLSNAQLGRILKLKEKFPSYEIGYSDHTQPGDSEIAIQAAYCFGARIFEKHFTYDKSSPGNDHYHAFDERDLRAMIENLKKLAEASNFEENYFLELQMPARKNARRGIYLRADKDKGSVLNEEDIIPLRPTVFGGVDVSNFYNIIGKTLKREKQKSEPILIEDLE